MDLDAETAREWFKYDAEAGVIKWNKRPAQAIQAGQVAGAKDKKGYWNVLFKGKRHKAHRLAWLLVYGKWPQGQVDHINGDKSNNRLSNLRECSQPENQWNTKRRSNNTSGVKGVSYCRRERKWAAEIMVNYKRVRLGYHKSLQDAANARRLAAEKLHGEYAKHE